MLRWFRKSASEDGTKLLVVAIETFIDFMKTSKQAPGDLLERQEAIERRMESLQDDCLKYLQKGTQSMRRAEKLSAAQAEEEDDEYPIDRNENQTHNTPEGSPFQKAPLTIEEIEAMAEQ